MQQEMESIENEERDEEREIQKLDSKFTNFDKEVQEKEAAEANRIRNERKKRLEEEMKRFEEEKEKFENDFEEMKTEVIQRVRILSRFYNFRYLGHLNHLPDVLQFLGRWSFGLEQDLFRYTRRRARATTIENAQTG